MTTRILTNPRSTAHADDPTFEYRSVAGELKATGHVAIERPVWTLCLQQPQRTLRAKKWSLTWKVGARVHGDWLRRVSSHRT